MARSRVYFLVDFYFEDGQLVAEYFVDANTVSTDPTEAMIFRTQQDAELYAIRNDLECQMQYVYE